EVVSRVGAQWRPFKCPLERREHADDKGRDEFREKREVANLFYSRVRVRLQPVRQQPALDTLVDAVQRRVNVAHVEAKQQIARVDLVDEERTTRLQHAQQLAHRASLFLNRFEVMEHVDDVREVVRAVTNGNVGDRTDSNQLRRTELPSSYLDLRR